MIWFIDLVVAAGIISKAFENRDIMAGMSKKQLFSQYFS